MDSELRETQRWLTAHAADASGVAEIVRGAFRPARHHDMLEARRVQQRVDLLLGAIWDSSVVLIDDCFLALAALEAKTADHDEWLPEMLPALYKERYDLSFLRRFLVSTATVTGALCSKWTKPNSVAEEIGLRLILDKVELAELLYELVLPANWRASLEPILFTSMTHKLLYSDSGILASGNVSAENPLRFERWFHPFDSTAYRVPYSEHGIH